MESPHPQPPAMGSGETEASAPNRATSCIRVAIRVRGHGGRESRDCPWLMSGNVITLAKRDMEQSFAFGNNGRVSCLISPL